MRGAFLAILLGAVPGAGFAAGCTDSEGRQYEDLHRYGATQTAWVTGAVETPHAALIACGARRVIGAVMNPDQPPPPFHEMIVSDQVYTLDSLADELSRQGYYVTVRKLKAGACVCDPNKVGS